MSADPFVLAALATAGVSAAILLWYLAFRPALTRATKVVLLLGIGVLPIATAATGNVAGYNATKTTAFCASSCHVMVPYGQDSWDPASTSLAARHARNEEFGSENCYACHADYGMFGTVVTKIGGMRHVYEYLTHFRTMTLDEARDKIHLRLPFSNAACIRCHSMQNPLWNKVGDHASSAQELRTGKVSCASEGCHGVAHPFSKPAHNPEGKKR